jgi:hypothetical protein
MSDNPNTSSRLEQAARVSRDITETIVAGLMIAAPIAATLVIAIVGIYAWDMVETLFRVHLGQSQSVVWVSASHLAAASSVGMFFIMLGISRFSTHYSVRAASGLLAAVYLVLILFLGAVKLLFDALTSTSETLRAVSKTFFANAPFMTDLGAAGVAVLVGLAVAGAGALAITSKNAPNEFGSENRARAHLIGNAFKIVVSLASVGFSVAFGTMILKMDPALALLGGLILDAAFIVSMQKAESAHKLGDAADAAKWRKWMFVYLVAIASMGIETMSEIAKQSPALPLYAREILNSFPFQIMQAAGLIFVITAVGLALLMIGFTSESKPARLPPTQAGEGGGGGAFNVRRAASSIGGSFDKFLGNKPVEQLPAGTTLAKDAPVKGVDYDITGELVLTQAEQAQLRALLAKQMQAGDGAPPASKSRAGGKPSP